MMSGRRAAVVIVSLLLFAGFSALGVWQLQRLAWKTALIARVEARVAAAPIAPPPPADWAGVSAERDEYRRVQVHGVFDHRHEAFVQALTEAGAGFWVLTPLRTDQGFTVLVNRGFVSPDKRAQATRAAALPAGPVAVTGLLRLSEPRGGFLRANDPASGRWYSRDVGAIARTQGLSDAAPYFIDADATPNPSGWPRGGLTVIRFPNSHLAYALTWFTLAAMTAAWSGWLLLARRGSHDPGT